MVKLIANKPTKARVKRACDRCRRRKAKCNRRVTVPCKNCASAGVTCTYNATPEKPGPKSIHAEVPETQRNAQLAAGHSTDLGFDGCSPPTTPAHTRGLLLPALVESCIEYFFSHVYSSEPVLHRQRAQEAVAHVECFTESYCMIAALCAYVMIKANYNPPTSVILPEMARISNLNIGKVLLKESVCMREGYDHHKAPTHMSVLTSWFYSGCYFGLGQEYTAWMYLQEAIRSAEMLGMHNEETYKHDSWDAPEMRVLYWLLFIAERTYALRKHRTITLYPTVNPPQLDEVLLDQPIAVGLELMINMFNIIDGTFINLWNNAATGVESTGIVYLHKLLSEAVPTSFECCEAQKVQIRITQQWLRLQIWQLSVSQGLVSSNSEDAPLTFKYPIKIARDLLAISDQFSWPSIEVHGVDLIEKLFDIACCLTKVGRIYSTEQSTRDEMDLLTLILILSREQSGYPRILAELRTMSLPWSLNLP